jgi:hypothetical protein
MKSQRSHQISGLMYGFVLVFLCGCGGSSRSNCEQHFKNARKWMNVYYKHRTDSLLTRALDEIEPSMQCKETRAGAIELKFAVLALLKRYEQGYKFADSLNENDFALSYRKSMYSRFMRAMDYESRSDTADRNKCYGQIVSDIENYLRIGNAGKAKFNEEAYIDLFFIKGRLLGRGQIDAEIDSLKQKYPVEGDFFDALKTSFSNSAKETEAMPAN